MGWNESISGKIPKLLIYYIGMEKEVKMKAKRLLAIAMAALTLLSVPTEAKASELEEEVALGEAAMAGNEDYLVSEKTYIDESGNEITEKVYVNVEKPAVSAKGSRSTISGDAAYRKEQEFYIYTGKTRREKIKCYVRGTFSFRNGRVRVTGISGNVTHCPKGVTVTKRRKLAGTNYVKFSFYAKSNYSKNKEYSVKLTVANDGRVY